MKSSIPGLLAAIAISLTLTAAEQCGRARNTEQQSCEVNAVAKDHHWLDGCGILLVLDDGDKLLATNLDAFDSTIVDGDTLRIAFTVLEDMMSICMAEQAIVRLECLEVVSRAAASGVVNDPCTPMVDPARPPWSRKVLIEIDPVRIIEMKIDDHYAYHYMGRTEHRIYDCHGNLFCTAPADDRTPCEQYLLKATQARIIYVVNE